MKISIFATVLLLLAAAVADELDALMGSDNMDGATPPANNVMMSLQLLTYTDPNAFLPWSASNDTYSCSSNSPMFNPPNCQPPACQCNFMFTTTTVATGAAPTIINSQFFVSSNGIVNIAQSSSNWNVPLVNYFNMMPSSIMINVVHYGAVFDNSKGGVPAALGQVVPIDSFTISPNSNSKPPALNTTQSWLMTSTLTGASSNTILNVTIGYKCLNNMLGPNCNFPTCTNYGPNAACTDTTGLVWSCQPYPQIPGQYYNCQQCPGNQINNGQCVVTTVKPPPPTNGPGSTQSTSGLVPSSFRGATIALAVILVLVVIIAVGVGVKYYMNRKNDDVESNDDDYHKKRQAWAERNDKDSNSKTSDSENSTPHVGANRGFRAVPDSPMNRHNDETSSGSSRSTSRRSSQVSHEPGDLQSAHSSLPEGGRTTPRLEARV